MKSFSNYKKDNCKAEFLITLFFKVILFLGVLSCIFSKRWEVLFISILAFLLSFLPAFLQKNYKLSIPFEFEIIFLFFIYATLFLGEVKNFYNIFWWWDIFLHTLSGIALGFIGFLILFILYDNKKIKASPILISLFSFSFAVCLGAIWEIFEFFMDYFFGLNMQKSGLIDTMVDLIVDSLGAFFASTIGFIYIKYNKGYLIDKLINNFFSKNPKFKKSLKNK